MIKPSNQACISYINQYMISKDKMISMEQFWRVLNSLHELRLMTKLNEILAYSSLQSLTCEEWSQWTKLVATNHF